MVILDTPVWSFRANWKTEVTERLSFLTDVMRAEEGAEQRRSLRETPRRTVEADFLLSGPERTFFDLFLNRLGGGDVLVPLYWDIVTLDAPTIVGTTDRIDFDNTHREFRPGYAIIMGKNAMTYEVVEIVSMDGAGVDLSGPVARQWPRGSKMLPLRRALIDDMGSPSHPAGGVATATGRFLLREANPWWPEMLIARHSPGWRYKLEPFATVGSDYSAPDYDDSAWLTASAPFYYRGPPHRFQTITDWGYSEGLNIGTPQDVWMRRDIEVAPGYTLFISAAFDNTMRLWVDGEPVELTSTGNGIATAIITPSRMNVVVCVAVDETAGAGGDNYTFADIEITQRLAAEPRPLPPYKGLPVFLSEPNWVDALDVQYDREVVRLDNSIGLPYQVDSLGRALVGQSHRWFLPGRDKLAAFRDLIYRNLGRTKSFWLPTFKHDFRLVNSPEAEDTQLVVENVGFQYVGGPTGGREYIAIKHARGTILRKIISVAAGTTSDTEKLNLDAPLGLDLSPGLVRRISFADVGRFDSDDFEITHHAGIDGLAECSALFRTFKNSRYVPEVTSRIVLPRHGPDWRYKVEPFNTVGSNYSAVGYDDSAWPVGNAPFFSGGPNHPWDWVRNWGYDGGTAVESGDIWMRRRFYCALGWTLTVTAAYDNTVRIWIDGVPVVMTEQASGGATGSVVARRTNPIVCVAVDETQGPGGSNLTFADIEISQLPPPQGSI